MPMFPDSGVPPADAKNSLPDVDTLNCEELWYSTSRCQPRFDPAAANAMLAEQMNLIMKGEVRYNCNDLNHVELATRYLIQRGIPSGVQLTVGPFDYAGNMDPPVTRYNNYMTIIAIPNINNQGAVRINLNGLGLVPVLRNDYLPLESGDLKAYIPVALSYFNGNFYHLGLLPSQVPLTARGALLTWIRTDGNDVTGDGTENSAAKAFRTINGALAKVGGKFAVSANFQLILRFGIPGTYEAGDLSGSPNTIQIVGDEGNPGAYRIGSVAAANNTQANIWAYRSKEIHLRGVTLLMDTTTRIHYCINASSSVIFLFSVNFEQLASNPSATFWTNFAGAVFASGPVNLVGNGGQMRSAFIAMANGAFSDAGSPPHLVMSVNAITFGAGGYGGAFCEAFDLSIVKFGPNPVYYSGIVGPQYAIHSNSILRAGGLTLPGTIAGTSDTGAQFIA